jgi:hypothetical protein
MVCYVHWGFQGSEKRDGDNKSVREEDRHHKQVLATVKLSFVL